MELRETREQAFQCKHGFVQDSLDYDAPFSLSKAQTNKWKEK